MNEGIKKEKKSMGSGASSDILIWNSGPLDLHVLMDYIQDQD